MGPWTVVFTLETGPESNVRRCPLLVPPESQMEPQRVTKLTPNLAKTVQNEGRSRSQKSISKHTLKHKTCPLAAVFQAHPRQCTNITFRQLVGPKLLWEPLRRDFKKRLNKNHS